MDIRSRTESEVPTIGEVPFMDSGEVIHTPTVQTGVTLVKNLPPKGEDGIYHHPAECECWFCDENAPEYVPANDLGEVA